MQKGKNADVGEKKYSSYLFLVGAWNSLQLYQTSWQGRCAKHCLSLTDRSPPPSELFFKKSIAWKPLPSLSMYARFCSVMMIKNFPLWMGGYFGLLTWGHSTSDSTWFRRQISLAAAAGSCNLALEDGHPCPHAPGSGSGRRLWGGQC